MPTQTDYDWQTLLRLIPGYDPFDAAGDCWFDGDAARRALGFFPDCLVHVEGALYGKPFILEPWQQSIIANLFGWKRIDWQGREVRRYREAFIFVPRKNGKTPLASGIANYVFFCDDEKGQQDYLAASKREQAGKMFRHIKKMIQLEPELAKRCRIYGGTASEGQSKSIVRESDNSFLRIVSADAGGEHGGNTHLAVIDELHAQPNRALVDVFQTSFASANRKQPLFVNITTAGEEKESICYEKYEYACRVRDIGGDPSKPGNDPYFLPVIYEASPDDDWRELETWKKANPNWEVSVSPDYAKQEIHRATETPDYERTLKQLNLNLWVGKASAWLNQSVWDDCKIDAIGLAGQECYGGLDMATTQDCTAFVLWFPRLDGSAIVLCWFWLPETTAKKRQRADKIPYEIWAANGHIELTEGDWCDYNHVEAKIKEMSKQYKIREIAYDPRECSMLAQRLQESGVDVVAFTQSFLNYNEPVKQFETLLGESKVKHFGNPVMRWMVGNTVLARNVANYRMPSKAKSKEKIDGVVAAVMALARSMLEERKPTPSVLLLDY